MLISGADPGFYKGGSFICRAGAEGSAQRHIAPISPRQPRKFFSPSGWTLVAPSCFALQVPDVKGLQDQRPPCASISCSNFAHATYRNTYVHIDHGLIPKPFGFSHRELQCNSS